MLESGRKATTNESPLRAPLRARDLAVNGGLCAEGDAQHYDRAYVPPCRHSLRGMTAVALAESRVGRIAF
jgi:hypothetical protein